MTTRHFTLYGWRHDTSPASGPRLAAWMPAGLQPYQKEMVLAAVASPNRWEFDRIGGGNGHHRHQPGAFKRAYGSNAARSMARLGRLLRRKS